MAVAFTSRTFSTNPFKQDRHPLILASFFPGIGFFKGMFDAVVGQSYVPDLIAGVQLEFAKLDTVMVQPARVASQAVSDAFQQLLTSAREALVMFREFPPAVQAATVALEAYS
jgi:hypothetical protein